MPCLIPLFADRGCDKSPLLKFEDSLCDTAFPGIGDCLQQCIQGGERGEERVPVCLEADEVFLVWGDSLREPSWKIVVICLADELLPGIGRVCGGQFIGD